MEEKRNAYNDLTGRRGKKRDFGVNGRITLK
jgi:hypothetical protein